MLRTECVAFEYSTFGLAYARCELHKVPVTHTVPIEDTSITDYYIYLQGARHAHRPH